MAAAPHGCSRARLWLRCRTGPSQGHHVRLRGGDGVEALLSLRTPPWSLLLLRGAAGEAAHSGLQAVGAPTGHRARAPTRQRRAAGRQDGQTAGGVKVGFSRRRQSSRVQESRPEPTPKSCGWHQAPQRGQAGRTGRTPLTAGEVELGLSRQNVIERAAVHAGSEVMGIRV
eukprot:scaffold26566_cov33-Phaeocystis_antarctica.AAC.2